MKKLLLILITLLLAISGAVTGCTCEGGPGGSVEADGLEITVNRAYFGEVAGWESFLVEVTLKNTGDEGAFIHFVPFPNLFLQDTDGDTYKTMKAFTGWKESSTGEYQFPEGELDNISIEPDEIKDLFLRFWDVPEDVEGLKLIYAKPKTEGGETRVSIPLEVEEAEPAEPEEATPTAQEPSEPEGTHEGNIYTSAPENPQTPGEVVAAFYFLIQDGKLERAKELASINAIKKYYSSDIPQIADYFADHPLQNIRIESEKIENGTAEVVFTMYTGEKRSENENIPGLLVREGGEWKFDGLR
jgi:hypothetical protein